MSYIDSTNQGKLLAFSNDNNFINLLGYWTPSNKTCFNSYYSNRNGTCFRYHSTALNFFEANQSCSRQYAHLVEIKSDHKQQIVWDFVKGVHDFRGKYYNGPYIGLSNTYDYRTFSWVSGTNLSYTSWELGFPQILSGRSSCAVVGMDGPWVTIPCDWEKPYICEMPLGRPVAIKTSDNLSHYLTQPTAIFIAMPFVLLLGLGVLYKGSCALKRRVQQEKSIKLKLPKLVLPFNKKFRDFQPFDDDKQEFQFNCFGPEDSSEHDPRIRPTRASP
eukprot:gene6009-12114_t